MTSREITILFVAAAIIHFLSSSLFPTWFYLDIILVSTVYIANYSNPGKATVLGCAFGLGQDILGLEPMLGLIGFSKAIIGFASCYLIRYLVLETNSGKTILLFSLSLLDIGILYGLLWLLTTISSDGLLGHALFKAIFTALLGTALFYFLDRFRFHRQHYSQL